MHRLHSKSSIHRLRLTAFLCCLKSVLFPVATGLLAHALWTENPLRVKVAGGLLLFGGLLVIFQWIIVQRTQCPLCMVPVMAKRRCTKHRSAKTFLGSHRLRVALAILFRKSFRCPYCNEPTALEVRDRSHYRSYSGS